MNTFEITLGISIAGIIFAVAVYFIWRQRQTLQNVRTDPKLPLDQRRYLARQCMRRLFGSFIMILLASMLMGSLFLDYDPLGEPLEKLPLADQDAAKEVLRLVSIYWMTLLMLVMAVLALAVFDLWATARHGRRQAKQLLLEHQEALEAELTEYRHRRAEMN